MAENGTGTAEALAATLAESGSGDAAAIETTGARSSAIAARGVATGADFAALMSALMSDVIEGKIPPHVASAAVNAGGKLLKVVEMEYKYGPRGATAEPAPPQSIKLV